MSEERKRLSEEELAGIEARHRGCESTYPSCVVVRLVRDLRRARDFAQRVIDAEELTVHDYETKYGPGSALVDLRTVARALLPEVPHA